MSEPMLFSIGDKTYKVLPFTRRIQKAFLEFMRFHELEAIKRARAEGNIDSEDYYVLLRQHLAHADYDLKFGSPHFFRVMANPDNLAELLWYAFTDLQECSRITISKWIEADNREAMEVFGGLYLAREREDDCTTTATT